MQALFACGFHQDLAHPLQMGLAAGQAWRELLPLRFAGDEQLPIGSIEVYRRPEYASVMPRGTAIRQPIFTRVQARFGARLSEIRPRISSVTLGIDMQTLLKTDCNDASALQIVRRYLDKQQRVIQVSVGVYPGSRFSFQSDIRVQRGGGAA